MRGCTSIAHSSPGSSGFLWNSRLRMHNGSAPRKGRCCRSAGKFKSIRTMTTLFLSFLSAAILNLWLVAGTVALAAGAPSAWNDGGRPPKLILQITVDQLRGDLPARYIDHMGEGGFRYLMQHGIWYAEAHHAHANTETVVGHTTLATGADPATHGMVANVWLDRKTDKLAYDIRTITIVFSRLARTLTKRTSLIPRKK